MIIVTGGAGFIGSNIVADLEEAGMGPIVVCDKFRAAGLDLTFHDLEAGTRDNVQTSLALEDRYR